MIKVKEEKMERTANYARVMREQTMLGNFIRLADYMFVEGEEDFFPMHAICTAHFLI